MFYMASAKFGVFCITKQDRHLMPTVCQKPDSLWGSGYIWTSLNNLIIDTWKDNIQIVTLSLNVSPVALQTCLEKVGLNQKTQTTILISNNKTLPRTAKDSQEKENSNDSFAFCFTNTHFVVILYLYEFLNEYVQCVEWMYLMAW